MRDEDYQEMLTCMGELLDDARRKMTESQAFCLAAFIAQRVPRISDWQSVFLHHQADWKEGREL